MQSFGSDFFWEIRYLLPETSDKLVNMQLTEKMKPAGLAIIL